MANVSQIEQNTPASQVYAAILSAALTVLALVGGLIGGLLGGSLIFHSLIEKAPDLLTYTLATIAFFGSTLSGSTLWGVGMARLARSLARWRAACASALSFVPITFLLNLVLVALEPIAVRANLPVHRLFTVLFVPSAFLIAGTTSLALGWSLGRGRAVSALGLCAWASRQRWPSWPSISAWKR
jgi:hypothetical protein